MTTKHWLGPGADRSVRPQGENLTMKNLISILVVTVALSFAGCKKKTEDGAASGSAPATGAKVDDKGTAPAAGAKVDDKGAATAGGGDATGVSECDEYLKMFDDVVAKCKDKLGPALDAMKQSRDAQVEAFKQWDSLDETAKKAAVEAAAAGCKTAMDALKESATAMGCTL